ncbi:single-stranded DNA-binding protein, partial [bacterium]|nr:single-stranded DNA-binding protein [bacterium]
MASPLVAIAQALSREVGGLRFSPPVTHVYNPTDYAWETHRAYLERYARPGIEALFVGINPGPWGMGQTGVPFGDPQIVAGWLGIKGKVGRPADEHPKRPVLGFDSPRREVSGQRLWGWARERFTTPEAFFARFFIHNFCPLLFMEESGRNRTPNKLPQAERAALYPPCVAALAEVVEALRPKMVVAIGKWPLTQIREAVGDSIPSGWILHPSPANPRAQR